MTHYVSLKDILDLETSEIVPWPEDLSSAIEAENWSEAATLLDSKYTEFRNVLLELTGLDTKEYFYSTDVIHNPNKRREEYHIGTRRSVFSGEVWSGPHWIGQLRSDLGFTTEHEILRQFYTEEKYKGIEEEILQEAVLENYQLTIKNMKDEGFSGYAAPSRYREEG